MGSGLTVQVLLSFFFFLRLALRSQAASDEHTLTGGPAGAQLAFVKLTPKSGRSKADVEALASKWTQLLRLGAESHKVYAVDKELIIIQIDGSDQIEEVKNFILQQDEAYEFEWNKQAFRKTAEDVPYDQLKKLRTKDTLKKLKSRLKKEYGRKRKRKSKQTEAEL